MSHRVLYYEDRVEDSVVILLIPFFASSPREGVGSSCYLRYGINNKKGVNSLKMLVF